MLAIKHVNHSLPGWIRATLAFEVPSKEALVNLFNTHTEFLITKIGVTYVHPKEQYNKKIGAKKAIEDLQSEKLSHCTLTSIELRDGRMIYHFYTYLPNYRPGNPKINNLEFGVSYFGASNNTRLEYANLEE